MRIAILILSAALALGAAPTRAGDPAKIAELITKLGNDHFRVREAAARELDAIGEPALEPLRKATTSPDSETASRATSLVARIEQRVENARLLAPTVVDLSFKNTPIEEAVTELAKKGGCKIAIEGDKSKLSGRTITLEIGKVPVWQALEMLCEKAGLTESEAGSPNVDLRYPEVQSLRKAPNPVQPSYQNLGQQPANNGVIVLVEGKRRPVPTAAESAVRIRAVNNSSVLNSFGPFAQNEFGVLLEVKPEPRLQMQQILGVKIDRAIDSNGRPIEQSPVAISAGPQSIQPRMGPGQIIARPAMPQAYASQSVQALTSVRMKRIEKMAPSIKELRGAVSIKVRTPVEALITIDNVLQAKGETAKGKGDASLKLIDVKKEENGDIKVEVELQHSNEIQVAGAGAVAGGPQGVVIQANVQIQIGGGGAAGPMMFSHAAGGNLGVEVLDANGTALKHALSLPRIQWQPNARTIRATLICRPEKNQEATRLVFRGTRLAVVEAPFVLKDVPLGE